MIDEAKLEARRVMAGFIQGHRYLELSGLRECPKHGRTEFYSVYGREPVCGKCHDESIGVFAAKSTPAVDGVPSELAGCTFANFDTDTPERKLFREQAQGFVKSPGSRLIVFLGGYGLGKSHLAVACLKTIGGAYLKSSDAVRLYTGAYASAKVQLFEQWMATRLLVIDEIGTGRAKDELPLLQDIIARRYDERRPLLLVTNMTYRDFLDYVGGLVKSRLIDRGECVQFTGSDYRARYA